MNRTMAHSDAVHGLRNPQLSLQPKITGNISLEANTPPARCTWHTKSFTITYVPFAFDTMNTLIHGGKNECLSE
jgi:hypothetical protein